jgi:uncharacterized protein YhhL (DUF1145 family)
VERAKYGVWIVWIGGLAAMLLGSGRVAALGHLAFWLTLLAHAVEFLANRPLFERAGGSMSHHLVQTLVYGLFHWMPIKRRLAAEEPPRG